jgi:hypothetical protein
LCASRANGSSACDLSCKAAIGSMSSIERLDTPVPMTFASGIVDSLDVVLDMGVVRMMIDNNHIDVNGYP